MGLLSSPVSEVFGLDEKKRADLKALAFSLIRPVAISSLVAYCLIGAVIVVVGSVRLIGNPWDNVYPEGSNVFAAIRAARTGQLYFSFRESPYLTQSYGPLFYGIAAASAWAAGLDMDMTVLVVRLISYACYLLCGFMVFVICKRANSSTFMSLLAALMAVGQHDFFGWNVTVRPDTIMILATLMSLFFAIGAEEQGWRSYELAGFAAGLAFLIKQTGLAVAIGILAVLVLHKEFRKAAMFTVGAAAPVLLVFLCLVWRKEVFLEQFTSVGKVYWSLPEGARFVWKALLDLTYIVPLFLGFLGFLRAVKLDNRWQLIASYAFVSGILALAGLPQPGSNVHYFFPGLVGSALLLPPAYEFLFERGPQVLLIAMLVPALTLATWLGIERTRGHYAFYRAPDNLTYAPLRQYRIISDTPFLALKGHDPDLLDAFAIHSLELMGRWDSGPVVEQIRQGKYDLVILRLLRPHVVFSPHVEMYRSVEYWRGISQYGPAVLSALNENYDVFCSSPFSVVLKPKGRSIDLSPDYFSAMFTIPCGTGLANKSPRLILEQDTR